MAAAPSGISRDLEPGVSILPGGLSPMDGHRADVQALRGLAVLLVVLFHAQVLAPGGFVGVDVFFVISGFVIGRLLVRELASTGTLSFRAFFARRVRRLLPALALMLTVVLLAAPLFAPTGASEVTSRTGVAAALFSANIYLQGATAAGYFTADAELNPLLHTWSLSVEEQFYFVVPVLFWALWRAGTRATRSLRAVRVGVAVLLAGSFVLSVVTTASPHSDTVRFAFFSPFTRAWEFAAGLALVLLPARMPNRQVRRVSVAVGSALIAFAAFSYSGSTDFPGVAALVPVVGTVLILHGGTTGDQPADRSTTAPGLRPLIRLGDMSYGWYLWHWPLIVFAGAFWPTAGRLPLVVAAVVSLAPAWMSTRWVDRVGRADGRRRGVPAVKLAACCIAVPIVAAVLATSATRSIDERLAMAEEDVPVAHAGTLNGCNGRVPSQESRASGCTWGDPGADHSVVLIGDSNADHFSETMIGAADVNGSSLRVGILAGCPFFDLVVDAAWTDDGGSSCRRFVTESTEELTRRPPDVVVIANATDKYLTSDEVALVDPRTGERAVTPGARHRLLADGLGRSIGSLRAAGARVVVLEVAPKPMWAGIDFSTGDCSSLLLLVDPSRCAVPGFQAAQQTSVAQHLERLVAESFDAETWNFGGDLCPGGRCESPPETAPRWVESEHISVAAAELLAPAASRLLGRDPPT